MVQLDGIGLGAPVGEREVVHDLNGVHCLLARVANQENKAALSQIQREKALAAAVRIEQFVRELEHQLAWIAQTPWGARGVSLDQRRLDSLRLLRHAPAVTEVSHYDPPGTSSCACRAWRWTSWAATRTSRQDPKFKQAVARKTYFSPVYFRKESEPYMTIALAGNGEDAGVVAAEANLKFIWDVVSSIKVGEGGRAYVVDAQGRLIAHPDISLVLQKTDVSRPAAGPGGARRRRTAGPATRAVEATFGRSLQGKEVLSASATIDPLGWLVFVDLPIAEAFAPIYASVQRTVVLLLVGACRFPRSPACSWSGAWSVRFRRCRPARLASARARSIIASRSGPATSWGRWPVSSTAWPSSCRSTPQGWSRRSKSAPAS